MTMPFTDFLPQNGKNVTLYRTAGVAGSFLTWRKPDACRMVYIVCVGAGGGGGGGQGGSVLTTGSGGGGGGAGAVCKLIIPAMMLPDTLFIQPGLGGAGGAGGSNASGSNGSAGTISYVLITPDAALTAANILCASGAVGAGGGGGGATGVAGAAGAGETIITAGTGVLYQYGLLVGGVTNAVAGMAGSAGGEASTSPIAITALGSTTNILTTGGAGGGATNIDTGSAQAGAAITGSGFLPTVTGGALSNAGAGGTGSNGLQMIFDPTNPFICTGGAGGGCGTNTSGATGGSGGMAGLGCGGGGGGLADGTAGTNVGGIGGRGGDGYILIVAA